MTKLHTGHRLAAIDITSQVEDFCHGRGDGLVSLLLPHATAGLAVVGTGPGCDEDLMTLLEAIAPHDERWQHRHGSPGHGADHVLPALVCPSVTIPVLEGRLALGKNQCVVVVDTNSDKSDRELRLSFIEG